jgi:hypothetical protein
MRHASDGKPRERRAATAQQRQELDKPTILLRVRGASGAVPLIAGGKISVTVAA